jgi:hypothetical protein
LLPATIVMAAHAAVPILLVVVGARQQFARTCCFDNRDRTVGPKLRVLGVERHQKMQAFARVCVQRGEQCRIGDVEISLVASDLRGVLRKRVFQSVAFECSPVFRVDRLVLPEQRVSSDLLT